ncbi:hypothetical protein [Shimia biformata]|uniref:hypothetical protein n=1 Tax=Shimia biformata TaxID=1294299 RepID=UPI00194E11D5|nr:hypothetical protein [Shimia biformata]
MHGQHRDKRVRPIVKERPAVDQAPTRIHVFGPFQVLTADGRDATPKGRKAKALLALVLLSKDMIRSRMWLQDKLWSSSAPAQGAASLRQELSGLGRHLSAFGLSFLRVTRETVAIDAGLIEADFLESSGLPHRAELLEGLDVNDHEFEEWLTLERQHRWGFGDDEQASSVVARPSISAVPRGVRPTVILEPFKVIAGDARLDAFAQALHEEMLSLLSSMIGMIELRDATRQNAPTRGHVISGSVRNDGLLRISAQLTEPEQQLCLWSERYRFAPQEPFTVIDRIATKLVEALQLNLRDGEWVNIWAARHTTIEAWEAFHKGRVCESETTREGLAKALDHYRDALERDPGYLPALVATGFCHLDRIRMGWVPDLEKALDDVRATCAKVIRTDPEDFYGTALRAFLLNVQGETAAACELMRAVVEENAVSPELLGYYAALLGYDGRWEDEAAVNRKALTMTPYPPVWIETNLALALMFLGEKAAWIHANNVLRSEPTNVRAHVVLTVLAVQSNNQTLAHRYGEQVKQLQPGFKPEAWAYRPCFRDKAHYRFVVDALKQAGL